MPRITLPDGQGRELPQDATLAQLAEVISPSLAKAALAATLNDVLVDLSTVIEKDARVRIITEKDPEALEVIRHSCAHLLAQAVKQLYPSAQVTIGPVIENGFYYDFSYPAGFTPEDLEKISMRMHDLVKQKLPVTRTVVSRAKAIAYFESLGERYKAEIIKSLPENETLTLYTQGDFTDLCRGPHVPNTRFLKIFKLMHVAGAYWRGDSKNEMLQRIYGTAWTKEEDLKQYLFMLEEAEKRDHRKLGKALDLFHFQEEAPGMVFWHEKGWNVWQVIEQHISTAQKLHGYQEIRTPQVVDLSLWQRSGHAEKYLENMFLTHSENRDYALKPMNCPCHVQVYNHGLRSYRDLPLRYSEFGCCHRNESSGSLHGLFRVRSMVQDDGHVFCREDQIESEVSQFIEYAFALYNDFGLNECSVKLATRPEQHIGTDAIWNKAEEALHQALKKLNMNYDVLPGEGAFYGPKIELHLKDSLGRSWQCGTVQVDFNMPGRLGAEYIAEDNSRQVPVMIHRAAIGSFERFIGMLIEHYAGNFPVWLAPIQVVVMGITDRHAELIKACAQEIELSGPFRVKADLRNEKIGFKIREHTLQKVPFLIVLGDKELSNNTLSVRAWNGDDLGEMELEAFVAMLQEKISNLGRQPTEGE